MKPIQIDRPGVRIVFRPWRKLVLAHGFGLVALPCCSKLGGRCASVSWQPELVLTGQGPITINRTRSGGPAGRPAARLAVPKGMGECPERQRGRTVNPLA